MLADCGRHFAITKAILNAMQEDIKTLPIRYYQHIIALKTRALIFLK